MRAASVAVSPSMRTVFSRCAAPALAGTALYAQIAVIDPLGSFAGLSFTSGLRIVLYHN